MNKETIINQIDNMNNLVELHLHLDGALSIDNCKKLAKLQNIDIPLNDEELKERLMVSKDCRDLNEFLTKFEFPLTLLQTKEGIRESVKNLLDELINQGLIYAEIRFAPQLHLNNGLTQDEVVASAIEGLKSSNLRSNLILCSMRGNDNHEANIETVKVAKKYLGNGVCAIDLAGAEGLFPTSNFEDVFKLAKELNIPFTIHAGEADGPQSVYDAIKFGTKRIGHGVRSAEDMNLVKLISEKSITLEVCPTSNICTCIYKNYSDMPIRLFLDNNVKFTINTDDPTVCNTLLKDELKHIATVFNLNHEDIVNLQLNAINASFADENTKEEVRQLVKKEN